MITIDDAMTAFARLEERISHGTSATLELITCGLLHHRQDDLVMLAKGQTVGGMTAQAIRRDWDDLDLAVDRRINDLARGRR